MADTLFGGAAPASSFDDDNEQRRRGHDAAAGVDGALTALYYDVPSTGVPSGVGSVARMFVVDDDDALLCEVDLQAVIPGAVTGWTRIDAANFTPAGPVDWPSGTRLRGWVATVGDGSPLGKVLFTDPGTFPKVSTPDGHLTCSTGLYGGGAVPPQTIPGSIGLFWDMDFEFTADASEPAELAWTPVLLAIAPQPLTVTPGPVTVAWTPVQLALTVMPVTAAPGAVTISWTPVLLALRVLALGLPATLVEPGLGAPGGTVLVPTAGGTVLTPIPSGRP